jgi:enoyl-CoA hydratase/carnithine racemase
LTRAAAKPAGAVRASKRLMRRVLGAQMAAASELEMREYASRLQLDDAEAFTAFFEKRPPDFTKFKATA